MKKVVMLMMAAALAGSALAQTFAIREPVEGARIRETYKVRIPARSLPGNAFIGIRINGQFIEAVRPEADGNDFIYNLDTRKLKLADGPAVLEATLYIDLGDDRPMQVINRTAVNVTIDNTSTIRVPEGGYDLRYRYRSGSELNYGFSAETAIATVSQAQALLGSRGFEVPTERENFRFLMAVDNSYANGDGMVRVKALPNKDRDYAFIRLASEGNTVRKVHSTEMAPVYMRLTNKGREVFGAQAPYFGIDGANGGGKILDLFLRLPFPVLPEKRVKPGDIWQGAFSLGRSSGVSFSVDRVTDLIQGRGSFEAVEYQRGVPCARIRTSVASGAADLKNLSNLGFNQQNQSLRLDSVAWLSLSGGTIMRHEISLVQEALVEGAPSAASSQSGAPAGVGSRGGRPGARGGGPGARGGGPGAGGDVDGGSDERTFSPVYDPQRDPDGRYSLFTLALQDRPSGPPPGFFGGSGGEGGRPRGVPGGGQGTIPGVPQTPSKPAGKHIVRVTLNALIELER